MATVSIPYLFQRQGDVFGAFVTELNNLVQAGVLNAQSTGKVHKVLFDLDTQSITLQHAKKNQIDIHDTSELFVPADLSAIVSEIFLPDDIEIRNFYVGKDDEFVGITKKIWFFIGIDGTVQDVTIVIADVIKNQTYSLITNPFTAQLLVYNGIKKPGI